MVLGDYGVGVSLADLIHRFGDGPFCTDIRAEFQMNDLELPWRVFFTMTVDEGNFEEKDQNLFYCVALSINFVIVISCL